MIKSININDLNELNALWRAQQKASWIPCSEALPASSGHLPIDMGYQRSEDVLVTNGVHQWVAFVVYYEDDPDAPPGTPPTWFAKENAEDVLSYITHWQPLLPMP